MIRKLVFWFCILAMEGAIQASTIYSFTFNSGTYSTTQFSFVTPTYLTAAGFVTIQPFTLVDGTSTWTFTQAYVTSLCAVFGTANARVGFSGNPAFCSDGLGAANSGVIDASFFIGGFPTQGHNGTFSGTIEIDSYTSSLQHISAEVPVTVTISQVPEPISAGLTAWGVLALAMGMRCRFRRGRTRFRPTAQDS